jgi:hypothetical protein
MAVAICLVFSFWSAFAAGDREGDGAPRRTSIEVSVSSGEDSMSLRAEGPSGVPGLLRIAVLIHGPSGPTITPFYVPFVFDQNGDWSLPPARLEAFSALTDFEMVMDIVSYHDGVAEASELWGVRMQRFPVGASGAPAPGTGGMALYAAPGTQSPLYPYTWAAILVPGAVEQEILFFEAAFTGIEGVIPVN